MIWNRLVRACEIPFRFEQGNPDTVCQYHSSKEHLGKVPEDTLTSHGRPRTTRSGMERSAGHGWRTVRLFLGLDLVWSRSITKM
jgi:hypothetical protein